VSGVAPRATGADLMRAVNTFLYAPGRCPAAEHPNSARPPRRCPFTTRARHRARV